MSALDQLSVALTAYAGLVVLAAGYAVVRFAARPPWLDSLVRFLEVLALARAVAGIGSLLGGHHAAEPTAYVGYLVASVCIIPIAVASFRPDPAHGTGTDGETEETEETDRGDEPAEEDRGVWSVGVVAVAAAAVGVIAVRMMMTL